MAYQFTKDLETGNRTIDSQHQQLIAAVNALLDACSKGAGRVQVQQTAQFLLNYTNQHFAAEEALQQKSRYPGYPRHKQLHEEFKKSATVLIQQIQQEGPNVATVGQINTLLAGWLIQHIKGEDKKLAAYLKSMS
ncbi:MAG TPA: hemerythrin family protein [Firmicutes bacterium]|nr:hemerythrin family protein [Bacillota bacterium]